MMNPTAKLSPSNLSHQEYTCISTFLIPHSGTGNITEFALCRTHPEDVKGGHDVHDI